MPTIFMTSADRLAISSAELTPCACIASLNCEPIDFVGLSAFIALCITTDRSRQRIAVRDDSVRPTRFLPLNVTLPPVISAGGDSSCAIANSIVDLPQPDSPTTPRNSPGASEKLTLSTASTLPTSIRYSTDRLQTSRIVSALPAWDGTGGCAGRGGRPPTNPRCASVLLRTTPPDRPQGRVADLVERVVEQRQRRAERDDAKTRCDEPQCLSGLERFVVLGRPQHRSPPDHVRVAEPDELQAGGEQHRVQRVGQEAGDDQRGHRRDDLHHDDVHPALAPDPGRLEEVAPAQRERLRAQLPGR